MDQNHAMGRLKRKTVLWGVAGLAALVGVVVLLQAIDDRDGLALVQGDGGAAAYVAIFLLIFGDAVIPIFPGETTLNAGATLAAQGELELGLVILAGALGAILGDSTLFWIARKASGRVQPQLDRAQKSKKIRTALDFLDKGAPMLIMGGRYVPGMRFVVNTTMGLADYPYRRFLPWSAAGGALWSAYTCLLAYWIGSSLEDYPLASIVISGVVTTAIITALFLFERRRRRRLVPAEAP
jgi:membrane-associated protein